MRRGAWLWYCLLYNGHKGGRVATLQGTSPSMASVTTVPAPETATANPARLAFAAPEAPVSAAAHAVPARLEVRMGRAAAAGAGINWLTLGVMVGFHLGAVRAGEH